MNLRHVGVIALSLPAKQRKPIEVGLKSLLRLDYLALCRTPLLASHSSSHPLYCFFCYQDYIKLNCIQREQFYSAPETVMEIFICSGFWGCGTLEKNLNNAARQFVGDTYIALDSKNLR